MFELRCSGSELGCSNVNMFQLLQAAAEPAKYVSQIAMHPADQNGDRNYVCRETGLCWGTSRYRQLCRESKLSSILKPLKAGVLKPLER